MSAVASRLRQAKFSIGSYRIRLDEKLQKMKVASKKVSRLSHARAFHFLAFVERSTVGARMGSRQATILPLLRSPVVPTASPICPPAGDACSPSPPLGSHPDRQALQGYEARLGDGPCASLQIIALVQCLQESSCSQNILVKLYAVLLDT